METELKADPSLVAYCGLYCRACGLYKKKRCPGCHENSKANWCKVRSCCIESNIDSCAACNTFENPESCSKFNNFMAKFFSFVFRSDRKACIQQIKKLGIDQHAAFMAKKGLTTIKK